MSAEIDRVYRDIKAALDTLSVRWYLFGAQAALIYGAMRFTDDVDITVELAERTPRELLEALAVQGVILRVPWTDDFISHTRVLPLLHVATDTPIDAVLAGPGLEEMFLARATTRSMGSIELPVVSVEDLVAMKILSGRGKDFDDVASVLRQQAATVSVAQIESTLALLEEALDQSDLMPRFQELLKKAAKRR